MKKNIDKSSLFKKIISYVVTFIGGVISVFIIIGIVGCSTTNNYDDSKVSALIGERKKAVNNFDYRFLSYTVSTFKSPNDLKSSFGGDGHYTLDMTYQHNVDQLLVQETITRQAYQSSTSVKLYIYYNFYIVTSNDNEVFIDGDFEIGIVGNQDFLTEMRSIDNDYQYNLRHCGNVFVYTGFSNDLVTQLEKLFYHNDTLDFDLVNNNWNPNALLFSSFSFPWPFEDYTAHNVTLTSNVWFAVGGHIYNKVTIILSPPSTRVYYPDTQTVGLLENYGYISSVMVYNSIMSTSLLVMNVEYVTIDNNTCVVYNSLKWVNHQNGYWQVLDDNLNSPLEYSSNYTNLDLFLLSWDSSISPSYNDGNFGNAFGLISQAFGGLANLLSIQVLPSLTLGTLLFVPLVATIVFAIIKILRK